MKEVFDLFAEDTTGPAVGAPTATPASYRLSAAPNPFNPRTVIHFDAGIGQRGQVRVFNLRGELVRTPHAGEYQITEFLWDGTDDSGKNVACGVYLIRASAGREASASKIALIR